MRLKVDWKNLLPLAWTALRTVLAGAIGGGLVALVDGCSITGPGVGVTL